MALTSDQARQVFLDANALQAGHFKLTSGRHSAEYWEKFWVLQWPRKLEMLCAEIARRYSDDGVEVVLGPTTGGILLAFEVARQLGARALYAETEGGERTLRRGLTLPPATRTLVVDDVMTSGGSVKQCLELAARCGADVVGAAVLVDRSGGQTDLGCRLESLIIVATETFDPADCPLCERAVPIKKPGSRTEPALR